MANPAADIYTCGGNLFNLLEPSRESIKIEEIAHALAHLCRFNGHVKRFYSVAQHSVMVSRIVTPEFALAGLLHDAAEAYLGDVTTPLKRLLPDYRKFEERIERAIFSRFGVPYPLPAEVTHADTVALTTEQRDLLPRHANFDVREALGWVEPLPGRIQLLSMPVARNQFLLRYREIVKGKV